MTAQGQWLVHGGVDTSRHWSNKDWLNKNQLWVFDFSSLTWSKAVVGEKPLDARSYHMMAYHQGALVIMGGMILLIVTPLT